MNDCRNAGEPTVLRVLVLEDCQPDAEIIMNRLRRDGLYCDWIRVESKSSFSEALLHFNPDIVLADCAGARVRRSGRLARDGAVSGHCSDHRQRDD